MITDQNNTGIPSALKTRLQFTKPIQTMNSGSTQNKLDPEAAAKVITSEKYNPIVAKNQASPLSAPYISPRPTTSGIKPTVDETGYNEKYGYATGIFDNNTGEELFSNPQYAGRGVVATPSYQDLVSDLGKRFSNLTEEEQIKFLNNVAKGVYKANGIPTEAVMTGDQYIANSKQDRYK